MLPMGSSVLGYPDQPDCKSFCSGQYLKEETTGGIRRDVADGRRGSVLGAALIRSLGEEGNWARLLEDTRCPR